MRLKRVRLVGFKTFADRTEFDLDGGLVVVTGPNGCGKSNLVDAILWGLGEGSARQLRAGSKEDIIFGGSQTRKPVGYAEVTLLFDNEDGVLPIDYPEVAVTRKLNRAGESEYQINRQPCRLRDIHELLADSGLGRSGYAIVGQREIDSALAASAEDRRAWIDEAAGVQRYRTRKHESLRRLNSAETHLERVRDILREIEEQREPLREEAETARRYKSIQASLREVESGLLVVELARAIKELETNQEAVETSQRLAEKEIALADSREEGAAELGKQAHALEIAAEGLRESIHRHRMAAERAEGSIRLAEQKLQALKELAESLDEEKELAAGRLVEMEKEFLQAAEEFRLETERRDQLRSELSGAGEDAAKLRNGLATLDKTLSEERAREAARLKLLAEQAHAQTRLKEIKRELSGIERSLPDLEKGLAELEQQLTEQQAALDAHDLGAKELQAEIAESRKADAADEQARRGLLSQIGGLEGRRAGLEMTLETHEGLNQGSRAVMEAVKQRMLDDVYVPVGEAVAVDKEYALAIETALGASASDLIVPSDADARRAIQLLKENRLGRATFQPVNLMRPLVTPEELHRRLKERGVVGRANEMVGCKNEHRPVIDSLLGRILIVETLDDALRLAKTQGWSRLVTLDGEVVHSAGAVTGGRNSKQGYGMLQRRADLGELEKEIAAAQKLVQAREKSLRNREQARAGQEAKLRDHGLQRTDLEEELKETRRWRNEVREEFHTAERQGEKLRREQEGLQNSVQASGDPTRVPDLEAQRDELLKLLAGRSADAENAEATIREADARVQQSDLRKVLAQRRLEAGREQEKSRERRLENLVPDQERAKTEIVAAHAETARLHTLGDSEQKQLDEHLKHREERLQGQQTALEQAKISRQNVAGLQTKIHESELARARADARRTNLIERLLEEYGLDEQEALGKSAEVEVPADAATLVARLRRELKGMGDVNLGAVEAYERLTNRYDELIAQQADIEEGMKQVQAGIRELDRLTRDRFTETFEKVSEAFSETFRVLFGNGEGKLHLTDPANLLESGIELDLTLPGKRRQPLELLSGGERSLCAAAFLFALLKVKPSPLVVLDEVDAPLDGRNVERFVEMLLQLAQQIQFFVITHNPTTIAASSNCLGVTMEGGCSMLVPIRFPEARAVIQA
jgi:chromosome segregation protein